MRHTTTCAGVLLLCIALLLAACGSPPAESHSTPHNEAGTAAAKNLTIALSTDPGTADGQMTTAEYLLPLNIFDRLVEAETVAPGQSEIVPGLAESWEISTDGLVYTFRLRQGVLFHNGEELTSDDVVYTFDRMLNPATKALNTDFLDMILGAKERLDGAAEHTLGLNATDRYTVEITLKTPFAPFLPGLAAPGLGIYNRVATEALGERFGQTPIGTGPFMLKDWQLDSQITLAAFPYYFHGAPQLDTLTVLILPDAETQRMQFEAGGIDIYDLDLNRAQIPYFRDNTKYKDQIISGPRVGTYYLALNQGLTPLDNRDLREAIAIGIDRELLLESFFYGTGTPAKSFLAPGLAGYSPDLPGFAYDPDRARELVAESGVDSPQLVIWQANNSPSTLQINEVLQAMLQEIGMTVRIEQVDSAAMLAARQAGDQVMSYYSSWSADYNDPDNFLYTFLAPNNTIVRSINIQNPRIVELLDQGRNLTVPQERYAAYQKAERIAVYEELSLIPLYHLEHLFVVSPRVQGFRVSWNGWSDMSYYHVSVSD